MNDSMSLVKLIIDASWVVQLVLLTLILASIASWAIILRKSRSMQAVRSRADQFESDFWSGGDLTSMFRKLNGSKDKQLGMESVFLAGFGEFYRQREQSDSTAGQIIEGVRRNMRVSQMKEIDLLENSLATLATIGSTSPYVGLFGTVWGIMLAIYDMGNSSTIGTLAPQIVEALIPTAAGLFAAIPATVAYNQFASQVDRIESRFDTFAEELVTILDRHARKSASA